MKEKIKIRQATLSDISQLLEIDREIWPEFPATEEIFKARIETFPQGQYLAISGEKTIGSVFSQLVKYTDWEDIDFTWNQITYNGSIRNTHNKNGDSIYGVGLAVLKMFQGTAASHLLIVTIVQLAIRLNCRYVLLGARIPSYHKHPEIPSAIYIKTYRGRRLLDPELSLYKRYGGEPVRPLPNYIPDPESLNYGVLIRWQNPFYNKPFKRVMASAIGGISRYL